MTVAEADKMYEDALSEAFSLLEEIQNITPMGAHDNTFSSRKQKLEFEYKAACDRVVELENMKAYLEAEAKKDVLRSSKNYHNQPSSSYYVSK
jgi:hypothetical protein